MKQQEHESAVRIKEL